MSSQKNGPDSKLTTSDVSVSLETEESTILPSVGVVYKDSAGRTLVVQEIVLGDPLGREVRGLLNSSEEYACSYQIWVDTWLKRKPRMDPRKMKDG